MATIQLTEGPLAGKELEIPDRAEEWRIEYRGGRCTTMTAFKYHDFNDDWWDDDMLSAVLIRHEAVCAF